VIPGGHAWLGALIFFNGIGMGGGLYETRAVYPNWRIAPQPAELGEKLRLSGQAGAARRFWPFVSPISALLAIVNVCVAWHQAGLVGTLWLMAALTIVLKSVGTYAYFVPTYVRRIARAKTMDPETLGRVVHMWTSLSPIRVVFEALASVAALGALLIAAKG
jgi:hypothetical protein